MGMMLVAHENGLGTVWVGAFMEEEVFDLLKLPGNLCPVAIVPVGYPVKFHQPLRGYQEKRLWNFDEEKILAHRRERRGRREYTADSLQHFVYYNIAIFANFVFSAVR